MKAFLFRDKEANQRVLVVADSLRLATIELNRVYNHDNFNFIHDVEMDTLIIKD
jgi:hypothetical protein